MKKLATYAIDKVFPLLSSINKPKYRVRKPTASTASEYIVINALPMQVNDDETQRTWMNVNCHAKDIADGVPAETAINTLSSAVLAILEKVSTTEVLIDFESSEMMQEEAQHEHYMNLRFIVRILNNF